MTNLSNIFNFSIKFLSLSLFLLSILSFMEKHYWLLELTTHFLLQYLIMSIILFSITAYHYSKVFSLINFITIVISLFYIYPFISVLFETENYNNSYDQLKIIHANVERKNPKYDLLLEQIENENPDIIVLQEIDNTWIKNIEVILSKYNNSKYIARDDAFGIGVFSKIKLNSTQIIAIEENYPPIIKVKFNYAGKEISLTTFHPPAPKSDKKFKIREKIFHEVPNIINNIEYNILIGDFNSTYWSYLYKDLLIATNLQDTKKYGIIRTFPSQNYLLSIPIDHCLVSKNLKIINLKVGKYFGSDHLPVICAITLR